MVLMMSGIGVPSLSLLSDSLTMLACRSRPFFPLADGELTTTLVTTDGPNDNADVGVVGTSFNSLKNEIHTSESLG